MGPAALGCTQGLGGTWIASPCPPAVVLLLPRRRRRTRRCPDVLVPGHDVRPMSSSTSKPSLASTGTAPPPQPSTGTGRAHIQVSFLLKPPPQPSKVYVASDELSPFIGPVILCSADDLLLLRVNIGRKRGHLSLKHHHDYYVYRAAAACPSLHLLESPPDPVFHRDDVGLLPHPDGRHYTVAALMDIGRDDEYLLLLYSSDTRTWTTRKVLVQPPQWDPLPKRIPKYCGALLRHYTSAVVTVGGEGGTMAWVDLWRSILLCDVRRPDAPLRGVLIPLPWRQMSLNDGLGVKLDFGGLSRAISFNRDKGCLVLVHLERNESPPPIIAATRGLNGEIQVLDWELTTWSNSKMSDSLEDWHEERTVKASNITIDAWMLKGSGLPCRPSPRDHSNDEATTTSATAAQQLDLHNLSICEPIIFPSGEGSVVYLVAREKPLHPEAWFLAVDMKKGALKHVAYIGNQDHVFSRRIYSLSRLFKYMNHKKRLKSSTTDQDIRSGQMGMGICVSEEKAGPAVGPYVANDEEVNL